MKKEEIIIDGKKMEIVVELSEEEKDDMIIIDEMEKTLDLENVLEITKKINIGELNE